jgi:hypothetical protein
VRNPNYTHAFKSVETLFHQYLTDQEFGGLYHSLDVTTLKPVVTQKGNIWKTNYRFSMFFAEALRLSAQYPERFAELNAQP